MFQALHAAAHAAMGAAASAVFFMCISTQRENPVVPLYSIGDPASRCLYTPVGVARGVGPVGRWPLRGP